jgi:hypothetical protein
MSEMRVPITDAFDDSDRLESVEVELTSKQIEWLREKADERDLSLDHVLRSVITAQIRAQDDSLDEASARSTPRNGQSSVPAPGRSGDGAAKASAPADSSSSSDTDADDGSPSIVDSLRSASERLQDLTEKDDEAETPDPHDTLKRLQARLGEGGDADDEPEGESPGTVILQNQNRSMFDMMEEE